MINGNYEMNIEAPELTPKQARRLNITMAMVFLFVIYVLVSDHMRKRGYQRDIPNKHHFMLVSEGDTVNYIVRHGALIDRCVVRYQSLFDGDEINDTLKYNYVYRGPFYPQDQGKESGYVNDPDACQIGDVFKANFNLSEPNNHRLIKSDLYSITPP